MGTGPFVVTQWDPGKKLVITARDDYWGGRTFLDSIEVELGKPFREQMVAFDLGKAQVIEVAPEQARGAAAEGRRIELSAPIELVALVFNRDPQSVEDSKQREALSLSIDRRVLNAVVLQNGGDPAGSLLPNWMTGYAFLFPADVDLLGAQQERAEIPETTVWKLGFDANDPTAQVLAERIILNARDAGLRLQLASGAADVRLVRVPLVSLDDAVALTELTAALGVPTPKINGDSVDDLFVAESALLKSQRVIPLLHLRMAWAVSKTVKDWSKACSGAWRLPDVWLAAEQP
ncbi:MAG: ABC transporter substrate-binding protein [Terriglobales bacterium]